MNLGENGFFATKWLLGNPRVEAPSCDCTGILGTPVLGEFFSTGFSDQVVTMVFNNFFTAGFSLCSAMQLQKTCYAVTFLNISPMQQYHTNRNQLCVWDIV